MKIIFLDIDGVLNNKESAKLKKVSIPECPCWYGREVHPFDKRCVERLNIITDLTGAKIVVSSTWRLMFEQAPQVLVEHMQKMGVTGEVIGQTPRGSGFRGEEIQTWLDEHKDVEQFVIIDDDTDMLHLFSHLVQTRTTMGIEDEDVDKAITMLTDS
jgi:hypothetical protein